MECVIDANIVISALISSDGKTRNLIFNDRIKLFAPDKLFEECRKYKAEILEKSGLSEEDFEIALAFISLRIEFFSMDECKEHLTKARDMTPDQNDKEYFAVALKLKANIWSNDKRLKNQKEIKIYATQELLEIL